MAAARGLTRFVGRLNEISQLRAARERVRAGHGQLLAIVGEAGVGKSRLIHEFVRSEPATDWRILEGADGIVRDGDELPAGNGIPERVFSDRDLRRSLGESARR